jgi:hypothetical protein
VYLPLAIVAAILCATLLGFEFVGSSRADTTGSVQVTGNVDKDVQIDSSGCVGAALSLGTLVPGDPLVTTAPNDCVIDISSNNSALGADLSIQESPVTANPAMQCTGGTCGADAIADANVAGEPSAGVPSSTFGALMMSIGGAAIADWALSPQIYGVNAANTACHTASINVGTCTFRFGARASATTDFPGGYQALVDFVVSAR